MKNYLAFLSLFLCLLAGDIAAQELSASHLPPIFDNSYEAQKDSRIRQYLSPKRIVWMSDRSGTSVVDAPNLLRKGTGQADLVHQHFAKLISKEGDTPGILFDFGKEIQGGIQIVTDQPANQKPIRIRIRLGESVSKAMSEIDTIHGATNDHAMRDFTIQVPWLGVMQVGNSGFRFARIDLEDADRELQLKEVRAIFEYRNIPNLGSFKSNDERLNTIWNTGAYTVHLNMQETSGTVSSATAWYG